MGKTDLRKFLDSLGLTVIEFARLIEVTPRGVNLWLAGEREIPGPVIAFITLFASLPQALQAKEIARLKQEDTTMYDGMYMVGFVGAKDAGIAALVFEAGKIYGSDSKVLYDGIYRPSKKPGYLDAHLRLTVPPGTELVQGVPAFPATYWFDIDCTFAVRSEDPVLIQTKFGPVTAKIKYVRPLPN